MKTTIRTLLIVIVLALSATVASAGASPYVIASFWMPDPLDPGQPAPDPATPPDTAVPGYWWRDTTNQNAIAQHSEDQFTGQVSQPYASTKLKVLAYSAAHGLNTIALISTDGFWIVSPGGGKREANAAKIAFQAFYPGIVTKTLTGIVYTGAGPEETWGSQFWRNSYDNAPVYASAAFAAAKAERGTVDAEVKAREANALGFLWIEYPDQHWIPYLQSEPQTWGADGFLGAGSMKEYPVAKLSDLAYSDPTVTVSQEQSFYVDSVPVTLIPTSDRDAGLLVWLPNQRVLIGDAGRYLPDAGSIYQAGAPIAERIAALDRMIGLHATLFLTGHGMTISGEAAITAALTAQRDALQSIYDQALARINAGDTIDEAAAAVALPAALAASPYNQELVSTVAGIVRNIYHEKLGWFGGETHELAATLTPAAKAAALVAALGGADNLVAAARTAELNARDLAGAEKALYLAEAAYEAAPEDATAREVYAQTLRKNAYMQESAQVRNYYLNVALHLGQFVADFAVLGDENTALHFRAADFSGHFFGLFGASLEAVQIPRMPSEGGALLSNMGDEVFQRPVPLSELDGLRFEPTPDWNGTTTFTWIGSSSAGYTAEAGTVTITIAPLNDAPAVSNPLADVTVDEDAASATVDLSAVFTDAEGDPLSYTVQSSNPALVSATLEGALLTLDFQSEQSGAATITVSAADEAGEYGGVRATDDFVVTVNPVNDAPWANSQTELVTAGLARTFTLDYGDVETAKADLVVTFSGPSFGTLDTSALPSVTYLAPADYIGPDGFTVTVTDRGDPDGCTDAPCAGALQAQATVTLDVSENSIKGRVFNDANANGSPDEGETGVAGVTVRLTSPDGSPAVEQVTGEDGRYAFNSLLPGTYQVRQDLLPGYVQTTPDPAGIDLTQGQALGGVDFGVVYSADLSVTLAADVNDKTIIYTFVVTNNGPAEALEAALFNVRPHGVSYTSVITTWGACQGGNTVSCEFGTLAAGESATVTIQANRTDKSNPIENTVTVTASTFDIVLSNNSATVIVE